MEQDDRQLVERAKTDPEAFGELYDRHARAVYRLALSIVHNPAQAEDVTAEVFLNALKGIGRYRDEGKPFTAWLYQITRHSAANQFRTRACEQIGDEMRDAGRSVEDQAMRDEEMRGIWRLVGQLPPAQRTAMTLRFREDLSLRTVAAMMGRSEPATKQLIFRAMQRLRAELAPDPTVATRLLVPSMI